MRVGILGFLLESRNRAKRLSFELEMFLAHQPRGITVPRPDPFLRHRGTRWAAQLVLSRALEESAPAEAAALRRDATRLGLPGELPYLGR